MSISVEERIQQVMAERGWSAIVLPAARAIVGATAERKRLPRPSSVTGSAAVATGNPLAGKSLPGAWQAIPDDYQHSEQRRQAIDREDKIAAWAIARLLGDGWSYQRSQHDRLEIVHRDGYGMNFSRVWNNANRFRVSPLRRHRTNEGPPAEITMDAARCFGSLATDIRNRMINRGLKESDQLDRAAEIERKEKKRDEFEKIEAVIKAWDGKMLEERYWNSRGPTANVIGGRATENYEGQIRLDISLPFDVAVKLGKCLREIVTKQ